MSLSTKALLVAILAQFALLLCANLASAALCDPSATFPNTWGGWTGWSACSAKACDTSGFETRTASKCQVGKTFTTAPNIAQCPPKAHPLFKACSAQTQPCKAPACTDYKWTYKVDYSECSGAKACSPTTSGKAVGVCCADANASNGQDCKDPVNPQASCQGFSTRKAVEVPCVVDSPCGVADVNRAAFDNTKCTDAVAQAEFCNGLAKLLGLVPSQVKITSTVGCSRRRQADGGEVSFQFVSPCGAKAEQLFKIAVAEGNNPITQYLQFSNVNQVTIVQQNGDVVLSKTIPPGDFNTPADTSASNGQDQAQSPPSTQAPAQTQPPQTVPQQPQQPPQQPQPPQPPQPTQQPPPIFSTWTQWSSWTTCSATCDGGQQTRNRFCTGGGNCPGTGFDTQTCNNQACTSTGWTEWGVWSDCSVTCGFGAQNRNRQCPSFGTCPGLPFQSRSCNAGSCSEWSAWSSWSSCSVSCGSGGSQTRTRTCNNGENCPGDATQAKSCSAGPCQSCQWLWQPQCEPSSGNCGPGTQSYSCQILVQPPGTVCCTDNPPPTTSCEIPCQGTWTSCQPPTDSNSCTGERYLKDPSGNILQTESCPIYRVGTWSAWTCDCSDTCTDKRTCQIPDCGVNTGCSSVGATQTGGTCSPPLVQSASRPSSSSQQQQQQQQTQQQQQQPKLPLQQQSQSGSPQYTGWGPWTACSVTCGSGTQRRSRVCIANCRLGVDISDTRPCSFGPCRTTPPLQSNNNNNNNNQPNRKPVTFSSPGWNNLNNMFG